MASGKLNINVSGGILNINTVSQHDAEPAHTSALPVGTYAFISHVSEDKERIGDILKEFQERSITFWVDRPEEIPSLHDEQKPESGRIDYGHDWSDAISRAVSRAGVVIGFCSRHAIEGPSETFRRELRVGLERGRLIQVLLDRNSKDGKPLLSRIDGILQSLQTVDLTAELSPAIRSSRMEYLCADIKRILSRR